MAKELRYDREANEQLGDVSCDKCGVYILTESYYENIESKKYEGLNHGIGGKHEYECANCKGVRTREYDDYVDPLHMYH